jgi:hypothetical protein
MRTALLLASLLLFAPFVSADNANGEPAPEPSGEAAADASGPAATEETGTDGAAVPEDGEADPCSFPFGDDHGMWVCIGGQKTYLGCPIQTAGMCSDVATAVSTS